MGIKSQIYSSPAPSLSFLINSDQIKCFIKLRTWKFLSGASKYKAESWKNLDLRLGLPDDWCWKFWDAPTISNLIEVSICICQTCDSTTATATARPREIFREIKIFLCGWWPSPALTSLTRFSSFHFDFCRYKKTVWFMPCTISSSNIPQTILLLNALIFTTAGKYLG